MLERLGLTLRALKTRIRKRVGRTTFYNFRFNEGPIPDDDTLDKLATAISELSGQTINLTQLRPTSDDQQRAESYKMLGNSPCVPALLLDLETLNRILYRQILEWAVPDSPPCSLASLHTFACRCHLRRQFRLILPDLERK